MRILFIEPQPCARAYDNQRGYNKALEIEFKKLGWETQPKLYNNPRLIGDFQKNDIFIEVQFGNSATLYRDYYKFHYGLTHNKLALAVLIARVLRIKLSAFFILYM